MPPPPPSKSYMLVIVDSSDEGGEDHHQDDEHDELAVLVPPPHVVSPPSPHAAATATTTTTTTTLPTGSPSWMDRIAVSLNLSASTSASTSNGAHSPSSSSTSEAKKLTSSEVAWMARCRRETPFSAMPHPLANGSRNQHGLQEDDDDYDHYDEIEEDEDSNLQQHTNSNNNNNNNSKACKSKKKKSKKSKKKKRKGTAVGHSKGRDDVAAAAATTPNGTTLPAAKFAKQQQQRHVSFGHVHVRVHGRTLGSDGVPLHGGWPLGLDYDACLVQTKTQNDASTVHQKAVTAIAKNSTDKDALVQLVTPPVVTIQLPSPTVDQYEAAKQLRLQERWMEWNHHGNHNKGKASFPSPDDSDSASIVLLPPTTYLETRQWDFKSCSKNPLFGILAERERMMLLLAYGESRLAAHPPEQQPSSSSRTHSHMRGRSSSLSSTASIHSHNSVEEPVNSNNNNSSSRNFSERVESDAMRLLELFGSFDAPSPPPGSSSSSSSSHDKSSSSSSANTSKRSNNTNTRRGRSNSTSGGSNNNSNNSTSGSGGERYNALFDKVAVHHVRNELEKIRTARSTHTGCTCRKLQMPAPITNNSNINSSSSKQRLKLSKVQTELRKRHLLPTTPTSREELELLLYNTIQAEPCCTNYDGDGDTAACPCLRHGIECQADACTCWKKSVVISTSSPTVTTTTTTTTMVSDIQTTCGNPYGMYVVDLDRVDAYRRQQLTTTCKTMWTTKTTTTTSDPTTTTTVVVGGGGSNSTIDPMMWCMEVDTNNNINNNKNDVSSMTVVPIMSPPSPRPVAAMTMAITSST